MIVNRNQPTLFGKLAEILPTGPNAAENGQSHAWSERGHGRITCRVLRAADAPRVDFSGTAQVMMTLRYRRPIGAGVRESKEITYAITSLAADQATPCAGRILGRWLDLRLLRRHDQWSCSCP